MEEDTILPNGSTRDFVFVNNEYGKFYLARITEPTPHKHTLSYSKSFGDCVLKDNWTDSILDSKLKTFIFTRISRPKIDSVNIDTFAIKYLKCGGRSKKSIMAVVINQLHSLKFAYNNQIASGFEGTGKVTVKFAIDEFGRVIYCNVMETTLRNSVLENEIESIIWKWKFKGLVCPGDVTEVIYPFIFDR